MHSGKIPPYGKALFKAQQQGLRPKDNIFVIAGSCAWQYGKGFQFNFPDRVLIIPPWIDPVTYFWPVRDCFVLIVEAAFTYSDYVDSIASALFRDNASRVDFFSSETLEHIFYDKDIQS